MAFVSLWVANLEKDLASLILKDRVLYVRWGQALIRLFIFSDYIVFDVRHVAQKLAVLDLNCTREGVSVKDKASVIILTEHTLKECRNFAVCGCTRGSSLAQVRENFQDLFVSKILKNAAFYSYERLSSIVTDIVGFCPIE